MIDRNPELSVLMSVYNDSKYVGKAIESILNQSYTDFEFIIINDGSTDDSLAVINQYACHDIRIKIINQENIGLTRSLNKGIKTSTGKYIARMDSDDISHPDRLQKQMQFLHNNTDYALVGSNVVKIDTNGCDISINKSKYHHKDIVTTLKSRNCFAHGSVVLNKSLLERELKYDEQFKYAQDYKLWTEIASKHKVANLKNALYKLRIHDKSISSRNVEQQSMYAGVVAYEFQTGIKIKDVNSEVDSNKRLRSKIGLILLMNFRPELAKQYFSVFSVFYYLSILSKYINFRKIKGVFK
jgi:glycosyltransferase involved in cell wall biosynthesis